MAQKYTKVSLIGSGSYGNVWIVNESDPQCRKVMKEVKLCSERDVNQAVEEVTALSRCKHENIIRYFEAFVDRDTVVLSIIMEYATEGDLDKHIKERKGVHFPNDVILDWFTQLLSALTYIHKRGILHRDIKPQNIFVDENHVLKLGDFGICRILHQEANQALTMIGTPSYLSPEICLQQPYNCKSDMWSAGCVLYELCCLKVPFTAANIPALTAKIIAGVYSPLPSHCDSRLVNAVQSLLVADPTERLSAAKLLQSADFRIWKDNGKRPLTPIQERFTPKSRKRQADNPLKLDGSPDWAKRDNCGQIPLMLASPSQGIDSKTYTIVRYPKLRHLSPTSPELSQLLARQRSMSSPRTAQAAGGSQSRAPHRQRQQDVGVPRLNLLQAVKEMSPHSPKEETKECSGQPKEVEMESYLLERIMEATIRCKKSASSSEKEKVVENIKDHLLSLIEPKKLSLILQAVSDGMKYSSLRGKFCLGPNITQSVFWYSMLQDFV